MSQGPITHFKLLSIAYGKRFGSSYKRFPDRLHQLELLIRAEALYFGLGNHIRKVPGQVIFRKPKTCVIAGFRSCEI
jgi:hypothetical protein